MKDKLPDGWKEVEISKIAKVDSGQGAPQGDRWYNGTEVFVKAGDLNHLTDSKYVGDVCQKIKKEAIKQYQLKKYPSNSVVFPKSGMSVKTENIAILKYDSYVVNHLAIIQPKDIIDSKIIFYLLKRLKISNLSKNPSYPSIRLSDINNFKLIWPSLDSRKQIVSILEKAESAKNMRKDADELTKDYLSAVFAEMFGNDIKKDKLIKKKVQELCVVKTGGTPSRNNDQYWKGNVPWIKTTELKGNVILHSEEKITDIGLKESNAVLLPKETILIAMYGQGKTRGRCAKLGISASTNQACAAILPSDKINTDYLFNYIKISYHKLRNLGRGGNQPNLNLSMIKKFEVPLPNKSDQEKFVKIVEKVEKLKEYQKESKTNIDNLFNALMQKSFKDELL